MFLIITVFIWQINVMLCYVMLCYVMLCYVMLCYVMLCYVMLCYVMLCYVMLCYVMLCYVMLCYVMLCYVMLCYVMLCYDRLKKCPTILYGVNLRLKPVSATGAISSPGVCTSTCCDTCNLSETAVLPAGNY